MFGPISSGSNQEFGLTNLLMRTENVLLQDVVEKQLFGCLEMKFKELPEEKINTTK